MKSQPAAAVKPMMPSKKSRAVSIYNAGIAAGQSRKDIIAQFRTELNMSDACATTYFQNCRSAAGLVVAKTAAPAPVVEPEVEMELEAA